ncbi:MAG: DUF1993 domain-containing protein [Burkholderiaceae bacterium]|jgi:hypothetical protein|nr:DUF1993 domain-containing protein [Burkholderiales bacterium]MCZ8107949.1 DUF1993 domain-containing protein [Burkholderiales bacterium]MCZ8338311.1 DUF1993 domain-containing protein [Burkholderiaceae bacterium]
MAPSLQDTAVPVFDSMLKNLSALLDKAVVHAQAKGYEPSVLLQSRLAPDMFPLTRQVQIATDAAKFGVARLTGVEPPKFADDEATFEQLKARIEKTRAFVAGVPRDAFEGAEARRVEVPTRTATYAFDGRTFLLHWAMPNFYFHVVTAYDILRHNGVEVGKRDYLGPVPTL